MARRAYRAISLEEQRDIESCGALRPGDGSLEGKWLAERLPDARVWAREFANRDGRTYVVIEVEVPDATWEDPTVDRQPNLDQIGPARYVPEELLPSLRPGGVVG